MTYSIAGICRRTGMIGGAITTSSPAVGSRCLFAEAGVGAVLTQNWTDPRLGPAGLALLRAGTSPEEALAALVAGTDYADVRQLALIDARGSSARFTGARITSTCSEAAAPDCVAVGNILASDTVAPAMVAAFAALPDAPIAERLLDALEAGAAAGGEVKQITSAALRLVHRESFPYVDLRVDDHPAPIAELRRLWELYAPMADLYVTRALAPY